jgi:hypothetical protein
MKLQINNMLKKVVLLTVLIVANYCCIAQVKFGITAGAQISSIKLENVNTDIRLSFNAGGAMNATLQESIYLHLQLIASGKGYTIYDSYGNKNIFRPMYLELPLTFRFKFNSTSDTKIFLGAGGYYAFGIGGSKIYYDNGYKSTEKINYGSTIDDDLTSTDAGLVFELGAVWRENYEGHFFYDMGIKTISPFSTSNVSNRVFGFNLTWYF